MTVKRMEADWEFEIGGGAPLIEARWHGFIDLRNQPELVLEIAECRELPGLADALRKLNSAESPVWTSKSDVFVPERIDPDEMDAGAGESDAAIACYFDLVPREGDVWRDPSAAEEFSKQLCARLRSHPLRCCRVDVVVRTAIAGAAEGLGATTYATACGATDSRARNRLAECLAVLAASITGR